MRGVQRGYICGVVRNINILHIVQTTSDVLVCRVHIAPVSGSNSHVVLCSGIYFCRI